MSQSQGKSLRLSTQKERHLQGEVQCVCLSIWPWCVDLQPPILCPCSQALRLLWQLGVLLKILPPWSRCMPDPAKKKERKELRKCLCLPFGLFLAQKAHKAIKVNGSSCCAWIRFLHCLFVFCMALCVLQHHPLDTSWVAKFLILNRSCSFVVKPPSLSSPVLVSKPIVFNILLKSQFQLSSVLGSFAESAANILKKKEKRKKSWPVFHCTTKLYFTYCYILWLW